VDTARGFFFRMLRFLTTHRDRLLRPALLVALAALLTGLTSPARAAVPPGLQIASLAEGENRVEIARDLDLARDVGATFVRLEIRWDLLEPAAEGVRDEAYVARIDHAIAAARDRGLRVAATYIGTPCWASSAPESLTAGCAGTISPRVRSYPPNDPATYARSAAWLAERSRPTVAWLEIWNEPDHVNEYYWAGPDKARTYAALLKAAYPVIKAAAPDVQVLGAAIVGGNGAFLKALYSNGAKGSYDALSVHYYDLVLASLRAIRQTMVAAGDRKPVWLGEYGWTSCAPKRTQGGHACVSRGVQGANITDTYRALQRADYLIGAVLFSSRDTPEYRFGLLAQDGKRKPSFASVRAAYTRKGSPARVKLRLRRSGRRVIATGSGPAADALELDVFRNRRLRYKVTFRLAADRSYRIVLPAALGTRGLQVRVYQYWLGGGTTRRI